jgi:hypothetical protein
LKVPACGGVATAVTVLDHTRGERIHGFPTFLPDRRHFVYSRVSSVAENSGIYIASLDAKPEQQEVRRRLTGSSFAAVLAPSPECGGVELLLLRGSTLVSQHFDTNRWS